MSDLNFITTDTKEIYDTIITSLENGVAEPLYPGDERRIYGEAFVPIVVAVYSAVNDACRQKMLRYARGAVLDAIGENAGLVRIDAQKATTTLRFSIGEAMPMNITIPAGTRVTGDFERYFLTDTTVVLAAGSTHVDVTATADEGGVDYNAIPVGGLNILVDLLAYIDNVSNLTATEGGNDTETDDGFRERIRAASNKITTAGPAASYRYWAMQADPTVADAIIENKRQTLTKELQVMTVVGDGSNTEIAVLGGDRLLLDTLVVKAHGSATAAEILTDYSASYSDNLLMISIVSAGVLAGAESLDITIDRTLECSVVITPILYGGEIPTATILQKVLESCSADDVRPLNDHVEVQAPQVQTYDIELVYYTTLADEANCVKAVEGDGGAIDQYIYWQGSALNRDINPDYLRKLILTPQGEDDDLVGAIRVQIVKPVYTELSPTVVAKFSGSKVVRHIVRGD